MLTSSNVHIRIRREDPSYKEYDSFDSVKVQFPHWNRNATQYEKWKRCVLFYTTFFLSNHQLTVKRPEFRFYGCPQFKVSGIHWVSCKVIFDCYSHENHQWRHIPTKAKQKLLAHHGTKCGTVRPWVQVWLAVMHLKNHLANTVKALKLTR